MNNFESDVCWTVHHCDNFYIVCCKLQSTQLVRVISKIEVRNGREAGTIHRWFTAVVLLS